MALFNLLKKTAARDILGVEIDQEFCKLAHLKSGAYKKEAAHIEARQISGLGENEISQLIKSLLDDWSIKNPDLVNVVASSAAITKNIEIPSVDPREIQEIINLQAGRHTPYSREEIIADFLEIGTYKHSYTKVLLIIVTRSMIKRNMEILFKAGCSLEKAYLCAEANAGFCARIFKLDTFNSPVMLLNIDANSSDCSIVYKNKPIFVRSLPLGTTLLASGVNFVNRFSEEVRKSLEAYQNEDVDKSPSELVVSGAVADLPGLESVLAVAVNIPVRILDYLKSSNIPQPLAAMAAKHPGVSFLNLLAGVHALPSEIKVNLVPEEIKLRKLVQQRGRDLIKTGMMALTAFVLIFFILAGKIFFKINYLKRLSERHDALYKDVENLESGFSYLGVVHNYLSRRGCSLEVLAQLYQLAPKELQISDLKLDKLEKLSLRGTAESMSVVFSFVQEMEKSPLFKDVKTKYTTKRKMKDRDVTDFEIQCLVER